MEAGTLQCNTHLARGCTVIRLTTLPTGLAERDVNLANQADDARGAARAARRWGEPPPGGSYFGGLLLRERSAAAIREVPSYQKSVRKRPKPLYSTAVSNAHKSANIRKAWKAGFISVHRRPGV